MVSRIPFLSGGRYYYKKFRSTVISDIWPEVLFFTLVAVSEYNFYYYQAMELKLINP